VQRDTNSSDRIGRRKYLALSAAAAVGLAGCSGSEGGATGTDEDTPTDTAEPTATSTATATPTATASESTVDTSSPAATSETLYEVLYGDDDIEGANALYHPESPAPPIKAENFEAYGGVEALDTSILSTEVVRQNGPRATVYVEVEYSSPAGTAEVTDYVYLRKQDDQWLINVWLPQTSRQRTAKEKVEEFYSVLYDDNDIEAANELYHPESDAPEITAEDFEPYGGLESLEASVESTEVVSDENERAEVHAEIEYTSPAGSTTNTDWLFLRLRGGAWFVDRWVPESVRDSGTATATSTDN